MLRPAADMPHSTLEPVLLEHYRPMGAIKLVREYIKHHIDFAHVKTDMYHLSQRQLCIFDIDKLEEQLAFLAHLSGSETHSVELFLRAYENRCSTHTNHCGHVCRFREHDNFEAKLLKVVDKQMKRPLYHKHNNRVVIIRMGRMIHQARHKGASASTRSTAGGRSVNMLFPRVKAKMIKWHAASTVALLTEKVAGHKLPPELVESIRDFWHADLEDRLSELVKDADEVKGQILRG